MNGIYIELTFHSCKLNEKTLSVISFSSARSLWLCENVDSLAFQFVQSALTFVTWHLLLSQFTFMEFKYVFDCEWFYQPAIVFENHFSWLWIYQWFKISYYLNSVQKAVMTDKTRNRNWNICTYGFVFEQ